MKIFGSFVEIYGFYQHADTREGKLRDMRYGALL